MAVAFDNTSADVRYVVGIMILLGINPTHSLTTPGERNFSFRTDAIMSTMSYNLFKRTNTYFHIVDKSTLPQPNTYYRGKSLLHIFLLGNLVVHYQNVKMFIILDRHSNS